MSIFLLSSFPPDVSFYIVTSLSSYFLLYGEHCICKIIYKNNWRLRVMLPFSREVRLLEALTIQDYLYIILQIGVILN